MQQIQTLKLEGGIPRDEKREVIRAMNACPLQKIVLIGINCPFGNTWGSSGQDLFAQDPEMPNGLSHFWEELEEEDVPSLMQLSFTEPMPPGSSWSYVPEYGREPREPMIHTIGSHHAATITELKFCGYRGSPVLWDPLPLTKALLTPLRHFHHLQSLVLSLWLSPRYEHDMRGAEIIDYWLSTRSTSKALVVVGDDEPEGWAKELKEKYEPERIANRIMTLVGPFLSERAKARRGGVHIRGSFCIGMYGGMFDFDINVGKALDGADMLLEWKGPREELHPERKKEKMDGRGWF